MPSANNELVYNRHELGIRCRACSHHSSRTTGRRCRVGEFNFGACNDGHVTELRKTPHSNICVCGRPSAASAYVNESRTGHLIQCVNTSNIRPYSVRWPSQRSEPGYCSRYGSDSWRIVPRSSSNSGLCRYKPRTANDDALPSRIKVRLKIER